LTDEGIVMVNVAEEAGLVSDSAFRKKDGSPTERTDNRVLTFGGVDTGQFKDFIDRLAGHMETF
jgi:hypothetical protein